MARQTTLEMMDGADLPPIDGPDRTAELLVAIAHRCVDWDVWGGARTIRYWDALAERVKTACYAGPTLGDWWTRLSQQMSLSMPDSAGDRAMLASLLAAGEDRAVLRSLRSHGEALVLRVRVAVDVRKTAAKDAADNQGALL